MKYATNLLWVVVYVPYTHTLNNIETPDELFTTHEEAKNWANQLNEDRDPSHTGLVGKYVVESLASRIGDLRDQEAGSFW